MNNLSVFVGQIKSKFQVYNNRTYNFYYVLFKLKINGKNKKKQSRNWLSDVMDHFSKNNQIHCIHFIQLYLGNDVKYST